MSPSRYRGRKPRRRRRLWALALIAACAAGLYYSGPLWEQGRDTLGDYLIQEERKQPLQSPVYTPGLAVEEFGIKLDPSGGKTVTGVLHNKSRVSYPYAEVRIDLQNVAGKTIGSTLAAVHGLPAGRSVPFTAPASVPDVHHVTVAEVQGFR